MSDYVLTVLTNNLKERWQDAHDKLEQIRERALASDAVSGVGTLDKRADVKGWANRVSTVLDEFYDTLRMRDEIRKRAFIVGAMWAAAQYERKAPFSFDDACQAAKKDRVCVSCEAHMRNHPVQVDDKGSICHGEPMLHPDGIDKTVPEQ